MRIALIVAGVVVALFLLDRVGGWILDWMIARRQLRPGGTTGVGNALLQVHSLFEPDKQHLLEAREAEEEEQSESGDPPTPGPTDDLER